MHTPFCIRCVAADEGGRVHKGSPGSLEGHSLDALKGIQTAASIPPRALVLESPNDVAAPGEPRGLCSSSACPTSRFQKCSLDWV
jgi:hypothetical protein